MRIALGLAAVISLGACGNPPGEVTVRNAYTGPCGINAGIVDPDDVYAPPGPLGRGEEIAGTGLTAGLHGIALETTGTACNRACQFSQAGIATSCVVYVAAGISAVIEIVDDGPCPMPRASCQLVAGNFDLAVAEAQVTLERGQQAMLNVTVTRRGYDGPIMLSSTGLPFDVATGSAVIAAGQTTGTLPLAALPMATIGTATITIAGSPSGPDSMATDTIELTVRGTGGSLDTTFSSDGIVTQAIGAGDAELREAVLETNGIFVAVGHAAGDWLAVRILGDGTLDPAFGGGDGIVTIPFPGVDDVATRVDVTPDGYYLTGKAGTDFTLVKLTKAGVLDVGFGGGDGIVTADFGGETDVATGLGGGGSPVIYVVGTAGTTDPDLAIAAFDFATGAPVTQFNTTGRVRTSRAGEQLGGQVVTTAGIYVTGTHRAQLTDPPTLITHKYDDQGLVPGWGTLGIASGSTMAGYTAGGDVVSSSGRVQYIPDGPGWVIEALDGDGTLSPDFGPGAGTTTIIAGAGPARGLATVDTFLYVAGASPVAGNLDFTLARVFLNGNVDTGWGVQGGLVTTPIGLGIDQAEDVIIDGQGKLVVVGWTVSTSGTKHLAIARYHPAM